MLRSTTCLVRFAGAAFAAFFLATGLVAQSTAPDLHIVAGAISHDGQVIVRWAPANHATWKWGNTHGYDLVRYTVAHDGQPFGFEHYEASMVVLGSALLPLPENDWEEHADENDLAGLAAGLIYGDSLDLLPPDGGNLLHIYNKSQERDSRFTFSLFAADQDFSVALLMGLGFVDASVDAGDDYAYFVHPHEPDTAAEVRSGFVLVQTDSVFVLPPPGGFSALAGDSSAVLHWPRDEHLYTSYDVERSSDGGATFERRNAYPLISAASEGRDDGSIAFADELPENGTPYVYRVRGRSPFGLLSPPSDTLQVVGRPDPVFAPMSVGDIEESEPGKLTVNWNFPEDMEAQIQGFDVYRGPSAEGPFAKLNTTLLAPAVRAFEDADPAPANYYQIRALDVHGYEMACFPLLGQLKDDTPPEAPTGLSATVSPAGVVSLHWAKNTEPDLMGYRVFTANSATGDYAQVTSVWINDTVYLYQLNLQTLSEHAYFCVAALDYHQNRSPLSEPIEVARPDVIPPAPPLITTVHATPQGVVFEWVRSSSPDVSRYEFQRKTAGLPGWTVLAQFDAPDTLSGFVDSTADKRRWYQYRLVAIDAAGNLGGSRVVQAKPINDGLRAPVLNLTAQTSTGSGMQVVSARLQWDYPSDDPDLIGFQVYRALDSAAMFSYRFFPVPLPASPDYADMLVTNNGSLHRYRFTDLDVAFTEPVVTNFAYFHTAALTPNLALPAPPGTAVPGSPQAYTPPVPPQAPPAELRYWVLAKFADGSYSPLAGAVMVQL